jgi:hypothetical protein
MINEDASLEVRFTTSQGKIDRYYTGHKKAAGD